MRKLILYMLLCMPVAMLASLPDDAYSVYPEVWLRQDTTVQILSEDSISWTDEYTMYAVVRSLQPDSTECLWSFTEDDTVSLAESCDTHFIVLRVRQLTISVVELEVLFSYLVAHRAKRADLLFKLGYTIIKDG